MCTTRSREGGGWLVGWMDGCLHADKAFSVMFDAFFGSSLSFFQLFVDDASHWHVAGGG